MHTVHWCCEPRSMRWLCFLSYDFSCFGIYFTPIAQCHVKQVSCTLLRLPRSATLFANVTTTTDIDCHVAQSYLPTFFALTFGSSRTASLRLVGKCPPIVRHFIPKEEKRKKKLFYYSCCYYYYIKKINYISNILWLSHQLKHFVC